MTKCISCCNNVGSIYAVKVQRSLAPLSWFPGSRKPTAHVHQCCRFQSYAKSRRLHAIANEIYKRNLHCVNHIPGIHDNGPPRTTLWRLTVTAYCDAPLEVNPFCKHGQASFSKFRRRTMDIRIVPIVHLCGRHYSLTSWGEKGVISLSFMWHELNMFQSIDTKDLGIKCFHCDRLAYLYLLRKMRFELRHQNVTQRSISNFGTVHASCQSGIHLSHTCRTWMTFVCNGSVHVLSNVDQIN